MIRRADMIDALLRDAAALMSDENDAARALGAAAPVVAGWLEGIVDSLNDGGFDALAAAHRRNEARHLALATRAVEVKR